MNFEDSSRLMAHSELDFKSAFFQIDHRREDGEKCAAVTPDGRVLEEDASWNQDEVDAANNQVRAAFSKDVCIGLYDPSKGIEIICDASGIAAAAFIMQDGKIICWLQQEVQCCPEEIWCIKLAALAHRHLMQWTTRIKTDHTPLIL
eukprot:TRINITY_DN486_c0_g1_i8.p1 TRINITY_DN486_c0_g1~~TRINITY_DN486_c0_g1_i8.p1  ORF type:complete len:147 (-),score=30.42 TRINITY_DN486_c0_g1_i8:64-504(-)